MPPSDHNASSETDRIIRAFVALDPIAGTQIGFPGEHNGRLPPTGRAERESLVKELDGATARLVETQTDVLTSEGLDAAVARAGAKGVALAEFALSPLERNPGWYVSTALEGLYGLFLRSDLTQDDQAHFALARLSGLPEHLAAARLNLTRPAPILVENALGDTQGAIDFCDVELRRELTSIAAPPLKVRLDQALAGALAALHDYKVFLDGLRITGNGEFRVGREAFDALLREAYLLPFNAEDLAALGQELVQTLLAELRSGSQSAFGTADWWEPIARLGEHLPHAHELVESYGRMITTVRNFVTERELVDLSAVGPVDVVPTPAFARTNLPFAAYVGAPPFGSGRAQFWVTPIDESLSPTDQQAALAQHHPGRMLVACIHEAFPGHHVEFSLSRNIKRPLRHLFRSTIYTEGWAFYCEDLMTRSGLLDDFADSAALGLAFRRDQLWRAVRILIDVGLHCFDMTPAAAVQLLTDNHVMSRASAEAEVSYSCAAPTQPLSYMVGRRLFESLVDDLRGHPVHAGLSLRDIHAKVLSHGPVPLGLLAAHLGLNAPRH